MKNNNIAVIGAGTWGMSLAMLLFSNGWNVTVWSAIPSEIEDLRKTRKHKNLKDLIIPDEIQFSSDLKETMEDKKMLVLAVPSIFVRQTAAKMNAFYHPDQIIVNVAKGIEENSLNILTDVITDEIGNADACVLSGPSHAEEVSKGLPTTCVAAAKTRESAEYIQTAFMNQAFRVYTSSDLLGVELGGALKNVIALAAGIADGLGYGDNAKAALITRGIVEMSRLGVAMGGKPETFGGLTGTGDLIVTCASMHSRNRRAGILIGKGYTMEEAMNEVNMVVEGVYSAKAALLLAEKYGVEMPIVEQVNKVLFAGKKPSDAVNDLMLRNKIAESSTLPW